MDPRVGSGRKDRAGAITVTSICSLKQLATKFDVGTESREAKAGGLRWAGAEPHPHSASLLPGSCLQK